MSMKALSVVVFSGRAQPHLLDRALAVRREVFIEEQGVPENEELDGHDDGATHILVTSAGVTAVARVRYFGGYAKIERVAAPKRARGGGLGRAVMEAAEAEIAEAGLGTCKLEAQTSAQGFYEKLGYRAVGGIFMDAGIPHILMVKALS